jgi:hypothetical protein
MPKRTNNFFLYDHQLRENRLHHSHILETNRWRQARGRWSQAPEGGGPTPPTGQQDCDRTLGNNLKVGGQYLLGILNTSSVHGVANGVKSEERERTNKTRTLSILFENEFALVILIVVLPATPVFSSLSYTQERQVPPMSRMHTQTSSKEVLDHIYECSTRRQRGAVRSNTYPYSSA